MSVPRSPTAPTGTVTKPLQTLPPLPPLPPPPLSSAAATATTATTATTASVDPAVPAPSPDAVVDVSLMTQPQLLSNYADWDAFLKACPPFKNAQLRKTQWGRLKNNIESNKKSLATDPLAAAARQGTAGLDVLLLWWLVVSWPRAVPLVRRACCMYVLCPYVCVIYRYAAAAAAPFWWQHTASRADKVDGCSAVPCAPANTTPAAHVTRPLPARRYRGVDAT